jgi:hypothetical protein
VIDLSGGTQKWKEKKKLSENIYIVSVLTDYLTCLITLFRSLKKIFSKNTENILKP